MVRKQSDDIAVEGTFDGRRRPRRVPKRGGSNHRFDVSNRRAAKIRRRRRFGHHSSNPLVNPVRNSRCFLCWIVLLMMSASADLWAQQSTSGRRSVRQSERLARQSWQPVRSSAKTNVRRVDYHQVESLPAPPPTGIPAPIPDPNPSIMKSNRPLVDASALDGQITFAPLHDGSVACDALPAGECGCGSLACGGCDSPIGCDAPCGSCDGSGCSTCGELCSPNAWRPCVTLCMPQDGWFSLEYLGWVQDGMNLPPLVTTSVDPNVDREDAGVLTNPSTRVLFGGTDVLDDGLNGARLGFGVWLNRSHTWGVGAELFELDRESEGLITSSTGDPILARPFFNTMTGEEDSGLVAYPGLLSGSIAAVASSKLSGARFYLRRLRCCNEGCNQLWWCTCPQQYCSRTEAVIGYRYLELEESVVVFESDVSSTGTLNLFDSFEVRNQFNGLDVGWMYRNTRGFWTFDTQLRLAVGNTRQTVRINGQTTVNDPTDPPAQTLTGGFLAQTTNIGTYRQNEFAVVPEFNMNLGYQMTDHLRVMLGYTFIYWSNVVRPGDQISRDINPLLFPPPANPLSGANRPAFAFDTTDYWVQGVNLGLEYRW